MPARSQRCRAVSYGARPTSIRAPSSAPLSTDPEMTVATARPAPAERTFADRLLAAVPLLSIFLWLCIIYAVEAWAHATPWLFGDELELTQLSRAIAATGHAARRGEPHSFDTLWAYLIAPAWRIDNVHTAYATVKYIAVMVMTLTAFPAYGLARMVVSRVPALFVVWVVLVLSAIFLLWRADWLARVRRRWSAWDWVGLVVLLFGAGVIVSALLGKGSLEWYIATDHYKHRLFDLGLNAAGALTIGLGVLPVVAALGALWRAPGERPTREVSAFRSVLLAAIIGFGVYTAVKSTYVSTSFGTYTYERNLIYLAPLLFVGTALWLERRTINPVALAASAGFVLYLLLTTPYEMGQDLSYNAPGLAILQQANRYLRLDPTGAKIGLVALLAFSVLLLAVPRFLRRGAATLAVVVGAAVIVWNFTGALAFASGSNRFSDRFVDNIRRPFNWVDDHTGGAPTLYIGQQMYPDQNGEWLLEFWNPHSLTGRVWSLDGTAQGPGPTLTPDPSPSDGALSHDPGYPYVVEERGIDVIGTVVATHLHVAGGSLQPWLLVKVAPPLRLRASVTGVFADGWAGASSAYTRYSSAGNRGGRVRIVVSRREWGGPDKAGHVTVRIGRIVIGDDKQPHVVRATAARRFDIHSKGERTLVLPTPGPRFRVE